MRASPTRMNLPRKNPWQSPPPFFSRTCRRTAPPIRRRMPRRRSTDSPLTGDVGDAWATRGRARACEGKRCEDQNQCAAGLTCSAHFCVAKTSVYRKQQTLRERRGRSPTKE